jgi:GT2 family glycosyltransferase
MISIVIITCNRPRLLRLCIQNVLANISAMTKQIIVWDNSDDPITKEILAALPRERFTVSGCGKNIGVNGYARAFKLATEPYLIELDDDVIDAPHEWDAKLLAGFQNLDRAGYLAADMVNDPNSSCAHHRWNVDIARYKTTITNGHTYHFGPTGGWCSMTSREVYDSIGGFREHWRLKFWREDGDYISRVTASGRCYAIYGDLIVHHASGPFYAPDPAVDAEKKKFYTSYYRNIDRRRRIRDALIAVPVIGPRFFARKNAVK